MVSVPNPWPSIGGETVPWEDDPEIPASRRALRRHRGPYVAAAVPAIAEVPLSLDADTLAATEDVALAIARFDAEMGSEIAPYASILLRTESAASSRIEHLTASSRAIAEAELSMRDRGNAGAVVANVSAMNAAIDAADTLDVESILAMHRALMAPIDESIAGVVRTTQVWIGGHSLGPHDAMFVPPHHRRVPALLDDLVQFMRRDDLPVIAHAAIAHAQFETIHPFVDGNGRAGRALLHAHLRNKAVTREVTVPISAGLLSDVQRYFDALALYRKGDPSAIVLAVVDAGFLALENGRQLIGDLRSLRESWTNRVRARRGTTTWRIADVLLRHPVVDASFLADRLAIRPENTYRAIAPLIEAGVLVESTDRRRGRVWRAPEVLDALDEFAVRAGRRQRP